jgi:hypothetical protein
LKLCQRSNSHTRALTNTHACAHTYANIQTCKHACAQTHTRTHAHALTKTVQFGQEEEDVEGDVPPGWLGAMNSKVGQSCDWGLTAFKLPTCQFETGPGEEGKL